MAEVFTYPYIDSIFREYNRRFTLVFLERWAWELPILARHFVCYFSNLTRPAQRPRGSEPTLAGVIIRRQSISISV